MSTTTSSPATAAWWAAGWPNRASEARRCRGSGGTRRLRDVLGAEDDLRPVLAHHPRQTYGVVVADWLSIEVLDGAFPASQWRYAHGEALIEAAVTNGASHWEWHEHRWGVLLELAFDREGS